MTLTLDPVREEAPASVTTRRPPWLLVTAGLTALTVIGTVVLNRRFYFYDDTQIGAFWNWYELGRSLRDGRWPMLDPSRWMGGNVGAEGQWGVWNPLVMLIGLGASVAGNALVFSTAVKLLFLVVAATGTHVLVRDRGVPGPMCVLAGVAAPLAGFTVYMDSPSWVTGLMTWALLPWAWLGLTRLADGRGGVVWPFGLSFLLVTVGYVHGTVLLAIVYAAVLVGSPLRTRDGRAALRLVGCGLLTALACVAVYLPSAASAGVTVRAQRGISNGDFLSPDLGSLVSSVSTEALSVLPGWWGPVYAPAPILYVAWFLPVLAFVDWSRARQVLRHHVDLVVVLSAALAWVLGPSDIGPLRFPVRVMPYVALTAIALVVILVTQAPARPISRLRLWVALGWVGVAAFLAWSGRPPTWEVLALGTLLTVGALVATRAVLSVPSRSHIDWMRVGGVMVLATLVLSGVQRVVHDSSPLPDFGLPADVSSLESPPPGAVDDVMVVGSTSAHLGAEVWEEALLGNVWFASDAAVQNVYTPVSFARYADLVCMNWRGETCADLVNRLFARQVTTGLLLVDQLSVNSIVMFKDEVGARWSQPADGWSLAREGPLTATWVRDQPVARAGGVVWQADGLTVTELDRSDTSVSLRVDSVPAGGGQVVLSRLAWPGYTAANATVREEATDGYLLTIDVPEIAAGSVVDITFRPPGWTVGFASMALAVLGAATWAMFEVVDRRRRGRRSAAAPSQETVEL